MFRTSDIVLITVMLAAAAFTYKTKHDAEAKYDELRKIQTQARLEEDTISILKADWSLLTQPSRLQKLEERYNDELGLKPVNAPQLAEFADLPQRPLTIEGIVTDMAKADGGPDRTVTGAVKP
ncbi:cell division protein FtsL [Nitratireductor indicus]|uniref:Uncharacterized protein n=1 Tax=Nitratireductor indicus C115 TaxID=1231190 RepID=K2P838_9HYPH|nr:hypothetical protein [Nitratireductor indicus]EKF43401.1 hypothetical protein NA8A_05198 [Nitratireductor indicus C115]MDS1135728.1 hypothetical protein [Nitratireductor indicus]SFQ08323.1 hypothetical protein SAMN05216176_101264 [Nitratireductor indicus]